LLGPTDEMGSEVTGIECVAQGRVVLLPANEVSQFVEYEVAPLPLARPHVAGVGLHGADLVVLVRLHDSELEAPRRLVTGALLFPRGGETSWAIEVSRVISIVRARTQRPTPGEGWLANATTSDGRALPWLDVDEMLADLGAPREGA
jgi:hypothetical protein